MAVITGTTINTLVGGQLFLEGSLIQFCGFCGCTSTVVTNTSQSLGNVDPGTYTVSSVDAFGCPVFYAGNVGRFCKVSNTSFDQTGGGAGALQFAFGTPILKLIEGTLPPVTSGTTPQNPTQIQPVALETGDQKVNQAVAVPPTTQPKLPTGFVKYTPKQSTYNAADLGLTADSYVGQQILMQESLLFNLQLKNPELINYAYQNRPIPYALGGYYNIGEKDTNGRTQIADAGELLVNLLNPSLYQAYVSRVYVSSIYPKKGDFYGAAIGTIDGCNLKMSPLGTGNFIPSGIITLPQFFFSDTSPLASMKVPIPVLDLTDWEYNSGFQNVGFFIDNAWELITLTHTIEPYNSANQVQNPIQIPTEISCSTAPS